MIATVATALFDEPLDDTFDRVDGAHHSSVALRGPPSRRGDRSLRMVEQSFDNVHHRVVHRLRVMGEVRVEHRLPDDAQSQVHHVFAEVALLPFHPFAHNVAGVLGHRRRIRIDAKLVKSRHDQLVLPLPRFPVVRNQAIAKERLPHLLRHLRLVDVPRVRDVDRVDHFRVTDEIRLPSQHPAHEHVPVLFVAVEHEIGSVVVEVERSPPKPMAVTPGGGLNRARIRAAFLKTGHYLT